MGYCTYLNKLLLPTRGIKHWGLSGYSCFLPRFKFGVIGQESSPQSPTISYRHPLGVIAEKPRKYNIYEIY